ncbi:hypothetical protein ACN6Q4_10810, partial [Acinetobacter baumannii]|uniref:hypothetical protein n=1 Tax=Acinetobacter baumannii TaxID=470 RepID=UPI0022233CBC
FKVFLHFEALKISKYSHIMILAPIDDSFHQQLINSRLSLRGISSCCHHGLFSCPIFRKNL